MRWDDLAVWGRRAAEWGAAYHRSKRALPVRAQVAPGDVLARLPEAAPEHGEPMNAIFADFERIVMPAMTHWQHPRFFAYFPTNANPPSVVADYLVATLSAQCMLWQTAPAATELETRVLDWLRRAFGLPEGFHGVIQGSASEATLAAALVMRERALGFTGNRTGLAGRARPRVYASAEVHSSVDRAAWIAGIGQEGLVRIASLGPRRAMDPAALAAAIDADRAAGHLPAGIVACTGGTSAGACDDIAAIAAVAAAERLYLHVDAAWAGNAMICPEYRPLWAGIEGADSIVVNPYKWLGGQFDGSVHLVRSPRELTRTLAIRPEYLRTHGQDGVTDYSEWSIPLGRRFRALKLWFLLRAYGLKALRARIRDNVAWSRSLAERMGADPRFEIVTAPVLSLFTFRLSGADDAAQRAFVARLNDDGRIYLTQTEVDGRAAIRFQVGQADTTEADVATAYEVMCELAGPAP